MDIQKIKKETAQKLASVIGYIDELPPKDMKMLHKSVEYHAILGLMEDSIDEAVESERERVIEEVAGYTEHDRDCILSRFEAGQPNKNGGYDWKLAGKWYQVEPVSKLPKCECGLDDILKSNH